MTQRGYSLLEAFIVLTALGLVVGGSLVPLKHRLEMESNHTTEELLHAAKGAVYNYALKNRTIPGAVTYYDGMRHRIPPGRPYLPCPDVDLDGVEDRVALPAPGAAMSVNFGGGCEETKGMLPWKTLGLRATDAWGNHLTYRVDARYSNLALGFDETFVPDLYDINAQLAPGGVFVTVTSETGLGALVCSQFLAYAVATIAISNCPNDDASNIVAGVITSVGITEGARQTPMLVHNNHGTGMVEGVVFVILSHGPDGEGAIGLGGHCRNLPPGTLDLGERANAFYRTGHPFLSAPFNCAAPQANTRLRENVFVASWRPPGVVNGNVDNPDDILLWSGRHELLGFLARNGAFPVDKLGYLPR